MSYDFRTWERADLLATIRYHENAPEVTTFGPAKCGCGNSRGGRVCRKCCMLELQKRMGYQDDDLWEIKSLEMLERYDELRNQNGRHNTPLMLTLRKGTAGYCHPPASGRHTRT
jgi:hypothetical protein